MLWTDNFYDELLVFKNFLNPRLTATLLHLIKKSLMKNFNPVAPGASFLYPLKTWENLQFPDVFWG